MDDSNLKKILPPSASLIMRREDVQKTSLSLPSAAFMVWMGMLPNEKTFESDKKID